MSAVPGGVERLDAIFAEPDCQVQSSLWVDFSATTEQSQRASYACHKLQLVAAIWKIHSDNPSDEECEKRQKRLSEQIIGTLKGENERTRTMRLVVFSAALLFFHSAILFDYMEKPSFHWNTVYSVSQKSIDPLLAGALLMRLQERGGAGEDITAVKAAGEVQAIQDIKKKAKLAGAPLTVQKVVDAAAAVAASALPSTVSPPRAKASSHAAMDRKAQALPPNEVLVQHAASVRKLMWEMHFTTATMAQTSAHNAEVIVAALQQTVVHAKQMLREAQLHLMHSDDERAQPVSSEDEEEQKGEVPLVEEEQKKKSNQSDAEEERRSRRGKKSKSRRSSDSD